MSVVTDISSGQFLSDGVYLAYGSTGSATPNPGATNLIGKVGTATDGPFNVPQYSTSSVDSGLIWGTGGIANADGTAKKTSILRSIINSLPEGGNFVSVRVGDGSQQSATIVPLDANGGVPYIVSMNTEGTNGNASQHIVSLQSGTLAASPILRVQLQYPGKNAEGYARIIAYATPGGPYDAPTFLANLQAAVNGISGNFLIIAGTSTLPPVLGIVTTASGGADGDLGVTSVQQLGQDGTTGRTGMYALSGTGVDFVDLCGITDPTAFGTIATFVHQEQCFGSWSFPQGTDTDDAIAMQTANSLQDGQMLTCMDFESVREATAGSAIYVQPADKVTAIVSSISAFADPSNKPLLGAVGIIATDQTATGTPLSKTEKGQRQQNGLLYLSNSNDGSGGLWKLPHGQASDGSNIYETRARLTVGKRVPQLLGPLVGEMQGSDSFDDTSPQGVRFRANAILNAYGTQLVPLPNAGLTRLLQSFKVVCDLTNNTVTSINGGFLIAQIFGETLKGVKFVLGIVYVGNQVSVVDQTAAFANAA